jgi:hypothetical protein
LELAISSKGRILIIFVKLRLSLTTFSLPKSRFFYLPLKLKTGTAADLFKDFFFPKKNKNNYENLFY